MARNSPRQGLFLCRWIITSVALVLSGAAQTRQPREGDRFLGVDLYGDPLPPGAMARLGTTRLRANGILTYLAFSPDSSLLAGCGNDVVFWDRETGKEMRRLSHSCHCFAFSPDGKRLALTYSGLPDAVIDLLDLGTGQQVAQLPGHKEATSTIAYSPDGKLLASGGRDNAVRLWDGVTGKQLRCLQGHEKRLGKVVFDPTGKYLASLDKDENICLWSVATGRLRHRLYGIDLAFSPDGKLLATCHGDQIIFWEIDSGREVRRSQEFEPPVANPSARTQALLAHLVFAPNGKSLISSDMDQRLALWDATSGKRLRQTERLWPSTSGNGLLALSPDGKTLACIADEGARLVDATTLQDRWPDRARQRTIYTAAFLPDGSALLTGVGGAFDDLSASGAVVFWDSVTGKELRRIEVGKKKVVGVFPTPAGKILFTAKEFGPVQCWSLRDGSLVRQLYEAERPFHLADSALSPDGKTLAIMQHVDPYSSRKKVKDQLLLLDAATGKVHHRWEGILGFFSSPFSPDSKLLVVPTEGDALTLLDVTTGKPVRQIKGAVLKAEEGDFPLPRPSAVFSPDGRTLATWSHEDVLRLWNAQTGKALRTLSVTLTGDTSVGYVAFSPDGKALASGDPDGLVQVWEVPTGKERCRFAASPARHRSDNTIVAFSPDGRRLVSGCFDKTGLIWDVTGSTGTQERPALSPKELQLLWADLRGADARKAHQAIWRLVFSPEQSLPFLGQRLQPVTAVKPEEVSRCLAGLDSNEFAVREKAAVEMAAMGELAETTLQKALQAKLSPEVRRRLQQLLENPTRSDHVWQERVLEILEQIGTPDAQQLLHKMAGGAPEAWVTQDARAALQRLSKRQAKAP